MPAQSSLDGFEDPPVATDRLFLGLFPPAEVALRIGDAAQALRQSEGLRGKILATDRFHVTLHHLGDYAGVPKNVVAMAEAACASLKAAPFELAFDRVMSFKRPRNLPFVMRGDEGLQAVTAFQHQLGEALKRAGLGKWAEAAYTPHVTLLYDDTSVAERPIDPITWTAHEFVLVHSLIGKTVHIPLARWPLLG
jgi:2'-5' RNA ligase